MKSIRKKNYRKEIAELKSSWRDFAACKGMSNDLFFVGRTAAAIVVCQECIVVSSCNEYAEETNAFGVWGGESRRQGNVVDPIDVVWS
jgi:hypothetical protein